MSHALRRQNHQSFASRQKESADGLTARAVEAARAGRRTEALELLDQALCLDESHLEALRWRGGLSDAGESIAYLERACDIDPSNERARQGFEWARARVPPAPAVISAEPMAEPEEQTGGMDLTGMLAAARSLLTERVAPMLLVAVLLLGLLGVASMAQAGFGKSEPALPDEVDVLSGVESDLPCHEPDEQLEAALPVSDTASAAVAPLSTTAPAATPPQLTTVPAATPPQLTTVPAATPPQLTTVPTATPPLPAASPTATLPVSVTTPTDVAAVSTMVAVATASPVTLDQAWKAEDWPRVIALVEEMLKAAPGDAELKEKLFSAYVNYGVQLVRAERLADAVAAFDKALAINPGDVRAVGERQFAQLYLKGSTALDNGDFAGAITPLLTIYNGNPDYRSVKARLYKAYIGFASALEKSGETSEAYLTYMKASGVDAQGTEAQAGLSRLKDSAPAKAVGTKKIEVDIAKQQMIVWEDGKVVYRFTVSTGKAPYLTRRGTFRILDKMPNAYSSSMLWGMPYWMGIYYAGKWENGIHAMARVGKKQTVLPDYLLGKPQTHGCIMLSDKNAKTLYEWAVVGTPVWIH